MSERDLLGYVVLFEGDRFTYCADCADRTDAETESELRENDAYGDDVPYPECHNCGSVIRPGSPEEAS